MALMPYYSSVNNVFLLLNIIITWVCRYCLVKGGIFYITYVASRVLQAQMGGMASWVLWAQVGGIMGFTGPIM